MKFQMPSRWWTYEKDQWLWKWTWRWAPFRLGVPYVTGGDEYGRLVAVWGTFLTGYVCFAYWTCKCADCMDARLFQVLSVQFNEEFADEVVARRASVRMRGVPPDGTRRV